MAIHAFPETLLHKTQTLLGEAFDYGVNACKIKGDDFVSFFLTSTICKRIEAGDPTLICGYSGIEIAQRIIEETIGNEIEMPQIWVNPRSIAHWIGWSAAYVQWRHNIRYRDIFDAVPYKEFEALYHPMHEADIGLVSERVYIAYKERVKVTNLRRIRENRGCSQSKLASESGVSLRSIQMYEQRNKDINKASAETLYRLSLVLGCSIEDLLER